MKLDLSYIKVTKPRRNISDKTIDELSESMKEVGLINPITVDGDSYELIAGAHRLAAARRLGWKEIECNFTTLDELKTRIAELDENLIRNEGSMIERAEWLAERKEIYEQLHPETKNGGDRGNQHTGGRQNELNSFCQDVAEKTDISKRAVEQSVQIGRDLIPEIRDLAKQTGGVTKTTALKLARLPAATQETIIKPVAAFVKTLPAEDRKEETKRLLEKQLDNAKQYDDLVARLDKEREVYSKFSKAISNLGALDLSNESLEIYYNELLANNSIELDLAIWRDALGAIEVIKTFIESKFKNEGGLS